MSRRAITDEQRIDAFLEAATLAQLERLQSDLRAVLRWKFGMGVEKSTQPKRTRRKAEPQLPLAAKVE